MALRRRSVGGTPGTSRVHRPFKSPLQSLASHQRTENTTSQVLKATHKNKLCESDSNENDSNSGKKNTEVLRAVHENKLSESDNNYCNNSGIKNTSTEVLKAINKNKLSESDNCEAYTSGKHLPGTPTFSKLPEKGTSSYNTPTPSKLPGPASTPLNSGVKNHAVTPGSSSYSTPQKVNSGSTPIGGCRRKLVTQHFSTPFRSPCSQVAQHSSPQEQLAQLMKREAELDDEIKSLQDSGYKSEELQFHIDNLHRYNDVKDSAQLVMGRLAEMEAVTVKEMHQKYGVSANE